MKKYFGKVASNGYAIGNIVEKRDDTRVSNHKIKDTNKEIELFTSSLNKAVKQLEVLYNKVLNDMGENEAFIFQAHKMILEDPEYKNNVINIIEKNNYNAAYSNDLAAKKIAGTFLQLDDEYLRARSADFIDVSKRIRNILLKNNKVNKITKQDSIILADDLSPSDTILLDRNKIVAFITRKGSINSHTAILARSMGIPALVNVKIPYDLNCECIVDAYQGEVVTAFDDNTKNKYLSLIEEGKDNSFLLEDLKDKELIYNDKKIEILSNINTIKDLDEVIKYNSDGVGLFRTEFLYLESKTSPTEEEQYNFYKEVLIKLDNKPVIIRTLDIGADKQVSYLNLDKEENPALGLRAIRLCLTNKDIFKTQLRAIYKASIYGDLSIMFPFITSLEEIELINNIIKEVKVELNEENIEYKDVDLGVMIETPAAVFIMDELSKVVRFVSIGTNDLTQYTLAIDRENPNLDQFYNPYHKSIFKMIQLVIDEAHKNDVSVCICGELAADTNVTKQLIKMGVDKLSVTPNMTLKIKKQILEIEE